jgi:hypothetical protein
MAGGVTAQIGPAVAGPPPEPSGNRFEPDPLPEPRHDLAITPDGTQAVARHANLVRVYDLVAGIRTRQDGIAGAGGGSDWVEVTNTRAVTVGANQWRIYNIGVTPAVLMASGGLLGGAGHDIAITPDGSRAVVRAGQGVHVFNLDTATVAAQFAMAGGGFGSDWVEVTNSRAVTLGANQWHVYDIGAATPVLLGSGTTLGAGAHDIAITPSGTQAVVRGGVGVHVLQLGAPVPALVGTTIGPGLGSDFAEATNARAITLGGNEWQIYDLGTVPATLLGSGFLLGAAGKDVDIQPGGLYAVVRLGQGATRFNLGTTAASFLGALPGPGGGSDWAVATNTRSLVLAPLQYQVHDISGAFPLPVATGPLAAGGVHDVVVTPDQTRALVRVGPFLYQIDLATGASQRRAVQGGSAGSDWVQATDTRAITLVANRTYIYDISGAGPVLIYLGL